MNVISNTWRKVFLGDVCEFRYGKSLPEALRQPGVHPVYGSNGQVGTHTAALTAGPTIIVGRKGSIGEISYSPVACWPIDTTYFIDNSCTDQNVLWLSRALRSLRLTDLNKSAAIPGLNREDAYRQPLFIPPLSEQRRIAAILNQADVLRVKRRKALALLDDMAQAIFNNMFGSLTVGNTIRLSEGVEEFRYGTSNKADIEGYPTLRIPNVVAGNINLDDIKAVPVTSAEFKRLRLSLGDLLFVRTNGNPDYVGRCGVVDQSLEAASGVPASFFIFASYLIRARLKPKVLDSVFVQFYLSTQGGRKQLREIAKTSAGQFNINTEGLSALRLPCVTLERQQSFASRVEALKPMRALQTEHLRKLDTLFASLQHRAFTGAL